MSPINNYDKMNNFLMFQKALKKLEIEKDI